MSLRFPLDDSSALHQVAPHLFYGNMDAGHQKTIEKMAVVHACKDPCHKRAVNYSKSLDSKHPEYICAKREMNLYLNMIDPPLPLFKKETFDAFFTFVDAHITSTKVLIHCNQGRSRAPSLALLYMAKRLQLLPTDSYVAAKAAFEAKFPYSPGEGIKTFLSENWDALGG